MRVAFLIGAGASVAAGLPSTDQVTMRVLTGQGVSKVNDRWLVDCGEVARHPSAPKEATKPVVPFLGRIQCHCQDYFDKYQKDRKVNYEDLYYAVAQISDHLHQEYENPAVEPFVCGISEALRDNGILSPYSDSAGLKELADEALSYIHWIVEGLLSPWPLRLDHVRCLVDAARDPPVRRVDVFTLNHDLVLEKVLRHFGIEVVDGFGAVRNGVRYWRPRSYEWSSSRC